MAQHTHCVLIGAALPGRIRVGKVNANSRPFQGDPFGAPQLLAVVQRKRMHLVSFLVED